MRTSTLQVARPLCAVLALALSAAAAHGAAPSVALGEKRDKPEKEEIDHLALAARLVKDGHLDRAEATLQAVNAKQEGLDVPRFHTLRGLIYLKTERHAQARDAFKSAIQAGQTEPVVHLYLAQAHFAVKEFKAALEALDRAGPAADRPGSYLLRAQAHWELKQPQRAIEALSVGHQKFPEEPDFRRRQFLYYLDLGLYQQALELGEAFVGRQGASEDDYVAIGEAMRQAREYAKAERILEGARLRFPDSKQLTLLLAHTYLAHGKLLTAALLFEELSLLHPEHALEAAELYIRAKRFDRALALNARIADQAAKLKQRMSILLNQERFEMVAAMQSSISRLGLLEQDDVRYALAYAFFKTGDLAAAERELKYIQDPEVFKSANELRKMMQQCREAGWECL